MRELTRDVVIVGAGIAGLVTARELRNAGASVAVLEARDRVGGRTWSKDVDGSFLELGGQWISSDQDALISLLAELGKETYPRYREGKSVHLSQEGLRTEYLGDELPLAPKTLKAIHDLTEALEVLASEIDPDAPWNHPEAGELDALPFSTWIRSKTDDPEAASSFDHFVAGGMLAKPTHAFSVLQAMQMAASAGSLHNLIDYGILLDRRVVGGMQSVATQIAAELGDDTVFLSAPVRTLRWEDNGPGMGSAVVAESDALRVHAKFAVLAIPPNLYSLIQYSPPLPRAQLIAHQHQSMGLVIKAQAAYESSFWRAKGLSGTGFGRHELVCEVYDNTTQGDARGTLVGFIVGVEAERLWSMPEDERREAVIESFVAYFGEEAASPLAFYLSDWGGEEWTRGSYACSYDLGGLSRWGHLQNAPVGPVFFASSDIQGRGYLHVDGAIRIGGATASRILAVL